MASPSTGRAFLIGLVLGGAVLIAAGFEQVRSGSVMRSDFAVIWTGSRVILEGGDPYLASSFGPAKQASELADADCITLLMDAGSALAAFAQVRRHPAPPCVTGPKPVEIYRFYVDRPFHGQGVAQQLMQAAHNAAAELDGETIWLSTWERNPRGRAFYAKCGFADVGSADFYVGADRQTDRILAMPVQERKAPQE